MKHHVRALFLFIFIVVAIVVISITLLTNQFFKFYESFIKEEQNEIGYQIKLVQWAVVPLLEDGKFDDLKVFCNDLKDRDIAIFILNKDEKLIAASRPDVDLSNIDISSYKTSTLKNYKKTLKNKMIVEDKILYINNESYILRLVLLQEDMVKTFLKNQRSIILVLFLSIIIILSLTFYVIMYIKIPFDKLQESALKIANGDLNTNIYNVPKGMLSEHAATIGKMASQLKQKISDLEYFDKYRTDFLSGLSHEVKTPLTGIMLSAELLATKIPRSNKETIKCLDILKDNCERLNVLILNIISLAALEYKKNNKVEDFETFNLQDVIEDTITIAKPLAGDIKINFIPEKNDIIVFADPQLIGNAVSNLLTNAIKYSKSKSIDVFVAQENDNAIIRIKDYGIGIPPEHLNNIFDKFYRVDKTRSRELGGTGLGLAIVKNIVRLHGGNISVKSENGCEFIIELPIIKKED